MVKLLTPQARRYWGSDFLIREKIFILLIIYFWMKENFHNLFVVFGLTLALFGIMNTFDKGHYIWWVMGIGTLIFTIITLIEFIKLFIKN